MKYTIENARYRSQICSDRAAETRVTLESRSAALAEATTEVDRILASAYVTITERDIAHEEWKARVYAEAAERAASTLDET